jgi:twitching motility protein PilI
MQQQDPLALLQQMQQTSLASSPGLPEEVEAVKYWSGVGFRMGDTHFVSQLDQVAEVLQIPSMTPVPKTKKWVKGLSNIRGSLVPVLDMADFFNKEPIKFSDRARVMIINFKGSGVGLLVNEVFGLRHFDEEIERRPVSKTDDPAMVYSSGGFLRDDTMWFIFDMEGLTGNKDFRNISS